MKRRGLRFAVWGVLALVVVLGLAVLGGVFNKSSVSPQVKKPLSAEQMQSLLPRGRELALAGDCFGCHSQTQGPRGSGGVAIDTPFGTLHSTNITPDPKYGIGSYTREDFHRVLRDGVALGGRNLYPAMPYVFTHITRPDDIDALYAYFMSIEPMAVPNVPNTGVFQFPVRPFMNFWNLLNFPDRKPPNRADRSAQWVRGAYLVEGLGHCAACHTPQNFMMGTDFARPFKGGGIEGVRVPDITAQALSERGFNVATLSQYLSTGMAPQGTAYADMYTVVHFSTSAMQSTDVEAIATYLLTGPTGKIAPAASAPQPLPGASAPSNGTSPDAGESDRTVGRFTYASACAGCHGAKGEGIPNVAPAMYGNSTLGSDSPHNLIKVILEGIPTQVFANGQRMYAMPGFSNELNDKTIANLATWLRAQWGGKRAPVTVEQVNAVVRAID
ncbi:cytochrome c [Neopusillimonas maritima]|uniref:Dehydrogenase n=1 Tax=Neopusillimonas maritima TaxID=2026239 RepID=A0A3A1YX95_9BURK|nr:cytochrome c [Neopusillimonas maritima]RIY42141.1 dehydrogenase [Neopusillimonas maritima]